MGGNSLAVGALILRFIFSRVALAAAIFLALALLWGWIEAIVIVAAMIAAQQWEYRRPYRTAAERKMLAQIDALRRETEDQAETIMNVRQNAASDQIALKKIQRAMTDEGMDAIAKSATVRIADIYAGHRGGVKSRDAAVYAIIHAEIREATVGEKHWNTRILAHQAYREEV